MNSKKMIPAALAAFVVLFAFNFLWFTVIFNNWVIAHSLTPPQMNIPMHVLGELTLAVLLAVIYPYGYKAGASAVSQGIKFGLLMGLVYSLPGALHMYASTGARGMPFMLAINGILSGIIGGIVIAMVYGNKTTTQA